MHHVPATADILDHCLALPEAGAQYALPGLVSFGGVASYHGPIATMTGGASRAARLKDAVCEPGEGRILVVDNGGHPGWAVLGDRLASLALSNGWAGIVLHGYVRDAALLRQLPIGVHALGTVPARPPAFAAGERDTAIAFLNVRFNPGNWLYADEDGIVVLPREFTRI